MELSKSTLEILRNFATINTNLLFKPGSKLETKSASNDIFAEVTVAEKFDKEAGIYNMNELLGVASLFNKPDFEFSDKFLQIKEGKNRMKYMYSDASLLTTPKNKINMPKSEIDFVLSSENLVKIHKASSALSAENLGFFSDGSRLTAKVFNAKNPTSNDFEVDLDVETTKKFSAILKIEKLKLLSGQAYDVSLTANRISRFKASGIDLTYYIAVESTGS